MKFKEQWVQQDILCPHCHQVTKHAKGLNKQNLKRLFFSKPTALDLAMLFIWIFAIVIALSYSSEITECQSVLTNFDSLCIQYMATPISGQVLNIDIDNLRNIEVVGNLTNLTLKT